MSDSGELFSLVVPVLNEEVLLRDTYQHTIADDGPLTNTRVFFCDPLTRWAVFVYGQDMHLPHHLLPTVPHYRLGQLHRLLRASDESYDRRVVECHGTFANGGGSPTVLDVLTGPPTGRGVLGTSTSSRTDETSRSPEVRRLG